MSTSLSLLSPADVQRNLANHVRRKRKSAGLSRRVLAERSTVPAPTIKRFELTGQISLRQLILLWQCVDSLDRVNALCSRDGDVPRTIDEVLGS